MPWNDPTADDYAALGEQAHIRVLLPHIARLMGDVAGKTLLDFGCAQGELTRHVARLGFGRVTALDENAALIANAKAALAADAEVAHRITFAHGNEDSVPTPEAYDRVLSSLVLMMCGDRPRLDKAIAGLIGSLAQDGRAVIILTHPCFRDEDYGTFHYAMAPGHRYWNGGEPYDVVLTPVDASERATIIDHHWPLSEYVASIVAGGGVVTDLVEAPAIVNDDGTPATGPAYVILAVEPR